MTCVLPYDGPCCSVTACEPTTCCLLQPHATPPTTMAVSHSLHCLFPQTPSLQALHCICGSKTESLWVSLLLTCARLYTGQTNAHPHPITSLKTPPSRLPTPLLLIKALPSCCDLNMRAPSKKRRHLAHALEAKKEKKS